jgi:tetratricopeptide (TPR) repeat protein
MDDLDVEQGIGLHRRAQGLAEEAGDADTIVRTYLNLGYALSLAGREREALQISQEGYQRARDLGLERAGGSFIATNLAWSLLVLGRWDECHQFTTRLLEGDAWNRFGPLAAQGRLLTWRGDFTAARASLEASLRLSPAAFADDAQLALVDLALWEGRHDEAEARITAGLRWCADHDPPWSLLPSFQSLVPGRAAAGRRPGRAGSGPASQRSPSRGSAVGGTGRRRARPAGCRTDPTGSLARGGLQPGAGTG